MDGFPWDNLGGGYGGGPPFRGKAQQPPLFPGNLGGGDEGDEDDPRRHLPNFMPPPPSGTFNPDGMLIGPNNPGFQIPDNPDFYPYTNPQGDGPPNWQGDGPPNWQGDGRNRGGNVPKNGNPPLIPKGAKFDPIHPDNPLGIEPPSPDMPPPPYQPGVLPGGNNKNPSKSGPKVIDDKRGDLP